MFSIKDAILLITRIFLVLLLPTIFLFLGPQNRTAAQPASDAGAIYERGRQQYRVGNYNRAIQIWERALELFQLNGDRLREGYALVNIGFAYANTGNHRVANEYFQQGLNV